MGWNSGGAAGNWCYERQGGDCYNQPLWYEIRPGNQETADQLVPATKTVTDADWESNLTDDIDSATTGLKKAARDLVKAAVDAITDAYNEWREKGLTTTIPAADLAEVKTALNNAVSQAQSDALEAKDTVEDAEQGVVTAGKASETENMADAVKKGVTAADQAMTPPTMPDGPAPEELPPDPEKSSLTSVLESYKNNLSTLPIVSLLNDAQVNISGSSSVLHLPVRFMGIPDTTITIDFANYESILDMLGGLLLTFVGFDWTIWLFLGRGEK